MDRDARLGGALDEHSLRLRTLRLAQGDHVPNPRNEAEKAKLEAERLETKLRTEKLRDELETLEPQTELAKLKLRLEADALSQEANFNAFKEALDRERLAKQAEVDTLKARLEAASLRTPWWKSSRTIVTVTAILAAVVPVNTAVREWIENGRSYELARRDSEEKLRTGYLERLKTPSDHLRTLRFIQATSDDPKLKSWATEEAVLATAEIERAEREVDEQLDLLSELDGRLTDESALKAISDLRAIAEKRLAAALEREKVVKQQGTF